MSKFPMFMRFPGGLRKAVTLSYDDGVEQDAQLIEILNRNGLKATFNLNSGLFAPEGTKYPAGQIHRRMSLAQAKALYVHSGHEVAVHCLTHASLIELTPSQIITEVMEDRKNLERDFGGIIRGMAYPFGTYNDQVAEVLGNCGIAYCRTVHSTHDFAIPQDWLRLAATCHHDDPQLMPLTDRFLCEPVRHGARLFYLWGHAYEFEANNNWQRICEFAEKMGGHDDVWYATNIDICDYHQAFCHLQFSADGQRVYNPTTISVWFDMGDKSYCVKSGEMIDI